MEKTNSTKNFLFMAVAKGNVSVDATEVKRYIGVGTVNVLAVNPNATQIKELMGYEPKEEPQYFGVQEVNSTKVPYARISFVIKTIPEKCNGIETTQMLTYFIRNQYHTGSQSGKYEVIDEYGRTAWATRDVIEAKAKIMYKDGTMEANVSQNYRPAYIGETAITEFIRTYLSIPSVQNYVNGTWITKTGEDAKNSECRLDTIATYFKGNFTEIKDAIALQPNNKVKVLFGIRTTSEGREYQDVYSEMVLRSNASNYSKLKKHIEDRKANGALSDRIYEFTDIHEYTVNATDLSTPAAVEDPFANASTEATPW